jgi:hypothetical protein
VLAYEVGHVKFHFLRNNPSETTIHADDRRDLGVKVVETERLVSSRPPSRSAWWWRS